MFIYHFNRMIRNRFLWLIFAIIVGGAFLFGGTCDGRGRNTAHSSEGTVDDEVISSQEYNEAANFVAIVERLSRMERTPMATETQIWAHIAAKRTAKKLGISVSTQEILTEILSTPDFMQNGSFDKSLYENIVTRSLGVPVSTYERLFLRDQIILNKLNALVSIGNLLSPAEAEDFVNCATDSVTFKYASFPNPLLQDDIKFSNEELRAFYDEHIREFSVGDRVGIGVAFVPVTNYSMRVIVPEEDIVNYYEGNIADYTKFVSGVETNIPLEEVRAEIAAILAGQDAVFIAQTNLASVTTELSGDSDAFDAFCRWANTNCFQVTQTGLMEYKEEIENVEPAVLQDFRNSAHALQANSGNIFDVVPGEDFVYVICALTNDVARELSFEEALPSVREKLISTTHAKNTANFSEKLKDGITAAMTNGVTFEDAIKTLDAKVSSISEPVTFSAQEAQPEGVPPEVTQAAISVPENQISKPILLDKTTGTATTFYFVYVQKRVNADDGTRTPLMQRLKFSGQQGMGAMPFSDWLLWNLKKSNVNSPRLSETF